MDHIHFEEVSLLMDHIDMKIYSDMNEEWFSIAYEILQRFIWILDNSIYLVAPRSWKCSYCHLFPLKNLKLCWLGRYSFNVWYKWFLEFGFVLRFEFLILLLTRWYQANLYLLGAECGKIRCFQHFSSRS